MLGDSLQMIAGNRFAIPGSILKSATLDPRSTRAGAPRQVWPVDQPCAQALRLLTINLRCVAEALSKRLSTDIALSAAFRGRFYRGLRALPAVAPIGTWSARPVGAEAGSFERGHDLPTTN